MNDRAAQRLVTHHPEIARDSIYTAIVCGDNEEVRRILAERPGAAREPGGPKGWTPILYLAFTRLTYQPTLDNAIEIARTLLDHEANPNDYYMAGDARYSVLTGIAGEGEQDSPRQPYAAALFQVLLERGAEPFDIQVFYDTHFSEKVCPRWPNCSRATALRAGRRCSTRKNSSSRRASASIARPPRRTARFLIERGAEIDPRDAIHNNTPLGWAAHFDDAGMLDLLSQYSRDGRHLAFCGYVDRLRDVLGAGPDLAKQVTKDGITPLWWLPDDEAKAMEVVDDVRLILARHKGFDDWAALVKAIAAGVWVS